MRCKFPTERSSRWRARTHAGPKAIIVVSAIVAFSTLVVMFYMADNWIGGVKRPASNSFLWPLILSCNRSNLV
jgi:hypothetical protein